MRAERALSLVVVLALVVALPVGAAASGGSGGQSSATPTADQRSVHMDVQLLASGDARWTVSTYVPLDGEANRDAFETLGQRYVNGTADVEVDADLFRRRVAAAESASGRSMAIPDDSVERNWTIEQGTGVLVLQFTWEQFARADDDRFVVDDAFETEDGTWLPRLERGQQLVVRPPSGVGFVETPRGKGVTNGTLRWEGPVTFGGDYFRIVYRTDDDPTTVRTTAMTPTTPPDTPSEAPPSQPPMMAFLLVALLGGGGLAAYLWMRRDRGGAVPAPDEETPAEEVAGGGTDATVEAGGDEPLDEKPSAGDDGPAEPTPEAPFAGVDVEMLSDEERVLRLLDANGGRMKQAQIVKDTGWSNAKVSQLLSRMEDDDAIDKLRIGRENLISMPDVDVDSFEE
jgi:hypothetical protein